MLNWEFLYKLTIGALFSFFILTGCATPPKPAPLPIPVLNPALLEGQTSVTGSGIPNSTVDLFVNGKPVTRGTTATNGKFHIEVSPLSGRQLVTATQTISGRTSPYSSPVLVKKATLSQVIIYPGFSMTIEPGQTYSLTAKGLFSNGRIEDPLSGITWSIQNPTIASIDAEGTVTGITGGTTTIQAKADEIQSLATTVRVKPQAPLITTALKAGDTTIRGTSTPLASINIMINEIPLKAQVFADAQGRWQATNLPSFNEADQVTSIQLVNRVPSGPSNLVVVSPPVLTKIAIHPSSPTFVQQGEIQEFTASGTFSNGRMEEPMPRVTWDIKDLNVATIDAEGKLTGLEAGTTTIKATREALQSASTTVTVRPQPPLITSSLKAGDTIMTGTASPKASIQILKNGISLGIELVADVQGRWQADGLPPLNENDQITGTQLINGIQSDPSIPVTVVPAVLTKIEIQPTPITIVDLGHSQQFTAIGTYSDGQIQNPLPGVQWLSENLDVAIIGVDGIAKSVKAGITRIQATVDGMQSARATLKVKPQPPVVTSPLKAGDTIVAGLATPSADIQILKNEVPVETPVFADAQGLWQASGVPSLNENDQMTAIQIVNNVPSKPSEIVKVHPNDSPVLNPIGNQTVAIGETLKLPITAIDPEGDTLSFDLIGQPLLANSLLNRKTGLFTFTPSTDQVGESTLTFKVSDGYSSQQETITIKITLPNSLVVLLDNSDGTVGMIQVTNAIGTQTLNKARQAVGLGSPNEPPGKPFMFTDKDLSATFRNALEATPQKPLKYLLYFETDTKLTTASEEKLPEIISVIINRATPDVGIIGHTDRTGSDEYNLELSLRRATAVQNIFLAKGIDPQVMEVTSHGEHDPLVNTPDGVSVPLNRRVEIIVR